MPLSDLTVSGPLRIAAVPARHPYVQNLFDSTRSTTADGVALLADPVPIGAAPGQWWPPVMLDPRWIGQNSHTFDLLHLHFGTESFTPEHLSSVLEALRAAGRPLVYTVHDLTNPQLTDQAPHLAQLELLVGAAAEVITLTEGAARAVRARFGREATVIGHPRLVTLPAPAAGSAAEAAAGAAAVRDPLTIGVHLRDLRPNIDARTAVDTLLGAVSTLREAGLDLEVVVELNDRVRDEATRAELRERLDGVPHARLNEHPRLTDDELRENLLSTDISVLPYGHGTHSGWLELCWDLGTAVAAPDVGFYAEQHPEPGAVATYRPGEPDSLARALLELVQPLVAPGPNEEGGEGAPDDAAASTSSAAAGSINRAAYRTALRLERAAQRDTEQRNIHDAHLAVYRRALAGVRV